MFSISFSFDFNEVNMPSSNISCLNIANTKSVKLVFDGIWLKWQETFVFKQLL
jgi:hypothetical protein